LDVTYDHWVWLDGYQLDRKSDATARRTVFAQKEGVRISELKYGLAVPVESNTYQ